MISEILMSQIQQLQQLHILDWSLNWVNIAEIFIIAIVLLGFYKKFIRNTQSEKLVRGILIIVLAWIASEVFIRLDLKILGVFIKTLVTLISLSLIVIFQPELRRFLGYLGQSGFMNKDFWGSQSDEEVDKKIDVIKEIIEAVKYLSKTQTGALIVFERDFGSAAHFDVGTNINSDVTSELILTIFFPNTPLHDGAMVIKDEKIVAAGVLLPLTEDPKLSWKYGTRHRAAIGMSEISDSACLVVSEETGDISMCVDGVLKKYEDLTTLKEDMEKILGVKRSSDNNKRTIFKINNLITIKKTDSENNSKKGNA